MAGELSLLLPVYAGDRPEFLTAAFRSSVDEQTRRPDQVVIVRDGPVSPELQVCIDGLVASSPVPVDLVELATNGGLGPALDAGLARCRHDIVARMDADDISLPQRFEVQLRVMEQGYDLISSALIEFGTASGDGITRPVLTDPDAIGRAARWESPFNHPAVVYRCDIVRAVGGYGSFRRMEDYLLWAKMIIADVRTTNVAEPLVRYRVDAGAAARRGGTRMARVEWELQREFRRIGFTTRAQFVRNAVLRVPFRLVPEGVRRTVDRLRQQVRRGQQLRRA